ncbi:MAG: patatin-like phospholipase family protein [Pseudomonadota bacterium]
MNDTSRPLRVLTLDGGGIRGVIPAAVLAYLEKESGRPISSLFDLIVGTSTGGILALALSTPAPDGSPKFSAAELETLYSTKGGEIFKPWASDDLMAEAEDRVADRLVALGLVGEKELSELEQGSGKPAPWWKALLHPKYGADGLVDFLKAQLAETRLSQPLTGTYVAANSFDLDHYSLKTFRSWEATADQANDFPMWAVGRATSAAPTYFPPAEITNLAGSQTLHLVDGGVTVNDPVLVGTAEARHLQRKLTGPAAKAPLLVVSVGTGQAADQSIPFNAVKEAGILAWFISGLMDVLLEAPNQAANQIAETLLPDSSFARLQAALSGPGFAASGAMDDWTPANIAELKKAAAYLVEQNAQTITALIERLTSGSPLTV